MFLQRSEEAKPRYNERTNERIVYRVMVQKLNHTNVLLDYQHFTCTINTCRKMLALLATFLQMYISTTVDNADNRLISNPMILFVLLAQERKTSAWEAYKPSIREDGRQDLANSTR
jgi:hypothetical protein